MGPWLMRIVNVLRLEKKGVDFHFSRSLSRFEHCSLTNGGTSGQVGSETRPHQNIMLLRHLMYFFVTSQLGDTHIAPPLIYIYNSTFLTE